MVYGPKARDPTTPYLVYAFVWRGKVFYVGLGQAKSARHTHRWLFVKNLVEHEAKGTLKPGKRRALEGKSCSVIAALIRAGRGDQGNGGEFRDALKPNRSLYIAPITGGVPGSKPASCAAR